MDKIKLLARTAGLAMGVTLSTQVLARCATDTSAMAGDDPAVLEVKATSLEVSGERSERVVTTLGTLSNPTGRCFEHVLVELRYFDAGRHHIDTIVEPLAGVVVPAGKTVEFRVREPASRDASAYVSQEVRVVDADLHRSTEPNPGNPVVDMLLSWLPMLVLIGVWIFLFRRQTSAKSLQGRMLVLMEQQLEVARAQSLAIQQAVAALERRARSGTPD